MDSSSKDPEVIIHIGTHKTGTTSIQRYLSQNREALKQLGIWYPSYSELLPGAGNHYAHLDFARSLDSLAGKPRFGGNDIDMICQAVTSEHTHYRSTIISAEPFWRVGFGDCPEQEKWKNKIHLVQRIRELFGGIRVKIVACLRDQVDFIESFYSEAILKTAYVGSIDDLIWQRSHLFDYLKQLETWESIFDLQVIGYKDLIKDDSLPRSFIGRATGISPESLPSDGGRRWNTTHPVECLVMKRYLNSIGGGNIHNIPKIYHRYKRFYLRRFESSIRRSHDLSEAFLGSRKYWLSSLQAKAIQEQYQDDNARIASKYNCLLNIGSDLARSKRSKLKAWQECFLIGWMLSNYPPQRSWFTRM